MQIRRFWLVLVAVLLPAAAQAHEHRMDLFGGFAIQSGSVLAGLHTTVAVQVPRDEREIRRVGWLVDASLHSDFDGERKSNVLSGIRYTFAQAADQKVLPFVQLLLGTAESKDHGGSDWDGAVAIGVGVERIVRGSVESGYGVRGQADFIVSGDSGARLSFGIMKRWPPRR
jgi:hypothetical protein